MMNAALMPNHHNMQDSIKTHSGANRKRILVLDKNPEDLKRLHRHLEKEGYEVVEAAGSQVVLEHASSGTVDLLVLDAALPELDGMAFCESLHANPETAAIPVMVVTEPKGTADGRTAIHIGADDFITRPLEMAELLVRTRMLLRMKELHDALRAHNAKLQQVNEELARVNQELAARNREFEMGMEMARRLQEAMLPQQYPAVRNVYFCHLYMPADVVGGDLLQIAGMSKERAAIFLSDVSGHGIRAALVTSIVKTLFEHVDLEERTPSEVLRDMNSRLRSALGQLSPHIFATGFLVVVDGENRSLSIASAGHPCPLLISKSSMKCERTMSTDQIGPALGFFSDPEYTTVERKLSRGDIVLGFTDGVYEVLNEESEMFGLERLQQLVARNARLIPRDLIQRLITETDTFRGSRQRADDVCLVAVEMD